MNVRFREVCLMRSWVAQAFAMPESRRLLFTQRVLQMFPDEEIAAISAHELAHLTEKGWDYYKRYVLWLTFLPWVFFKPLLHVFGATGFFFLLVSTIVAPLIYRSVSHRLEVRADKVAQSNEPDPGTYARALARLYEDGLLPAVNPDRATHPHLYDRMLAVGVKPDFPRPAPPGHTAWHGFLFSCALGALAAALLVRLTRQS
jgi:Zn-dependent protease with chaperone function